jgi:FlhB-like protein
MPTPKRVREARERGQVAQSKELTGAFTFATAVVLLAAGGLGMVELIYRLAEASFRTAPTAAETAVSGAAMSGLSVLTQALAPYLACLFGVAFMATLAQVGPSFSLNSLAPDLNRLNPGRGLAQIVSARRLVHLAKVLVIIGLLGSLTLVVLSRHARDLALLPTVPPLVATTAVAKILLGWARWLVAALIVIGIVDYSIQRRLHGNKLMMTKDEVKRERREQQGDPVYHSRRQKLHRELIELDLARAMRRATVLVTNPTRFAVALFYDEDESDAPEVVAKGRGYVAAKLRTLAEQLDVPIVEDVSIARSLQDLEIGDQIPEQLYETVAEILRFVYELEQLHG